jgi:hypothetical protein
VVDSGLINAGLPLGCGAKVNRADSLPKRKGARAAEWNGFENRRGRKFTGGSNPPPSAIKPLRRFAETFQGVPDGVPKYL